MQKKQPLRWVRLDNAAKIYSAARRKNWSNLFHQSVTLLGNVDVQVLQSALDVTVKRFPSIAARLRKGAFLYYLQQVESAPRISEEYSYPLAFMDRKEMRKCAFRVIAYENRIMIPFENGVFDRREQPKEEELEDSFLKYAGNVPISRKDTNAWHMPLMEFLLGVTFQLPFVGWSIYLLCVLMLLGGLLIYLAINSSTREVIERKLFF